MYERALMPDVLQHRKLYEQVVERIRDRILSGELKSGDQLPNERSLGEQFGVSRTVIREAMKTLIENGLVEVRRGQGTFVVDSTADALKQSLRRMMGLASGQLVDEMVEVRELLEPEFAARAALRRDDVDVTALRDAIHEMELSLDDAEAFIEADNRFHIALAVATHNHLAPRLLDWVVDLLQELRGKIFHVAGGPERGQRHHRAILAALEAGDAQGARQAMLAHLSQVSADGRAAVGAVSPIHSDGDPSSASSTEPEHNHDEGSHA
jgi:GntR family transcriptional regulator, transcriptional repressor for pyruvate dehydrogenase complex